MMDAVSAVGIAAAAAQFLGTAVKATALCRQIRDNATSATDHNQELEELIREIKESQQGLKPSSSNRVPRRIVDMAAKCEQTSTELLRILEDVRGRGRSISTAQRLFRVMKERKTIEKLESSLREKEKLLQSLIIQDIWRRFDLQSVQQSDRFTAFDARLQHIIEDLAKQQVTAKNGTDRLMRDVASIHVGISKRLDQSEQAADKRHADTEGKEMKRFREEQQRAVRRQFLQSLFFPEINQRRSAIKDAAPGTLEWVFSSAKDNARYLHTPWDSFGDWLRDKNSVYWICGKLGSGKSTLMAHLMDDSRTKNGLDSWCQGQKLCMLSFFFWRPGTELQKSVIGLLRSLLYQVCRQDPEIIDRLMGQSSIDRHRLGVWTERDLRKAIMTAIGLATDTRFCFFIDGLDEFLGNYDELLDLVFDIEQRENAKFCLSSRPEVQLMRRLAGCEQLLLQQLNYSDIATFVRYKLNGIGISETVSDTIVLRAEGVFLWAALVTQAVIRGAISADDEATLMKRINSTPQAINELFARMLESVDDFYKAPLASLLATMQLVDSCIIWELEHLSSIPVLTAARTRAIVASQKAFTESCRRMELQVLAQSAGLLEIRDYDAHQEHAPDADSWKMGRHRFLSVEKSDESGSVYQELPPMQRILAEGTTPYPNMLRYETRRVEWVHRSAQDFVQGKRLANELHLPLVSLHDNVQQTLHGYLRYFATAPSYEFTNDRSKVETLTISRLYSLIICLATLWDRYTSVVSAVTDQLRALVAQLDFREVPSHGLRQLQSDASYAFWEGCARFDLWTYLLKRIHLIPPAIWTIVLAEALKEFGHDMNKYEISYMLLKLIRKAFKHLTRGVPSKNGVPKLICNFHPGHAGSMSYNSPWQHQHGDLCGSEMTNAAAFGRAMRYFWDRTSSLFRDNTRNQLHALKVLELLLEVSTSVDLFLEIKNSGERLRLQLSALLFQDHVWKGYKYRRWLPTRADSPNTQGLRLICLPWWHATPARQKHSSLDIFEETQYVMVALRLDTSRALLKHLTFLPKEKHRAYDQDFYLEGRLNATEEELNKYYTMIEHDIWVNEQGLDATEQLFAVTCVRLHLRTLLKAMMETEEIQQAREEEYSDFEDLASDDETTVVNDITYERNAVRQETWLRGTQDEDSEWTTDEDEAI